MRGKRPLWLTLIGIVIVLVVSLSGVNLPKPVRSVIEQLTGASLPVQEDRLNFKSVNVTGLPKTPNSFGTSKRLLYEQVYQGHAVSFYCGCPYDAELQVNLAACGVQARKSEKRANRIEAEHVMPASHFGQHRPCWREELCTSSSGKPYKGRRCCEDSDDVFRAAHNDLHNLWPAVGEINGDRRDYRWGMISGERHEHGGCDIEIDSGSRRAEPPEGVRGDIARTYFYMEDTYGFNLSDQQRQLMTAWNKRDPPDEWERQRNERIKRIQNKGNRFIEEWQEK